MEPVIPFNKFSRPQTLSIRTVNLTPLDYDILNWTKYHDSFTINNVAQTFKSILINDHQFGRDNLFEYNNRPIQHVLDYMRAFEKIFKHNFIQFSYQDKLQGDISVPTTRLQMTFISGDSEGPHTWKLPQNTTFDQTSKRYGKLLGQIFPIKQVLQLLPGSPQNTSGNDYLMARNEK